MELYSPLISDPPTTFPLHVDASDIYHEPPLKRQRVEIDPLIMEGTLHVGNSVAGTPVSPFRPRAYSDAIDPTLEEVQFAHASIQQQSSFHEHLSEQIDLSAEYLALFDMEHEQSGRTDANTRVDSPRLRVHAESCADLPQIHFSEEIHGSICADVRSRMLPMGLSENLLPTLNELRQFFSGYLEGFHRHFPIIHLQSFDPYHTPSPLIMAMCSIGAQYRLCRPKAKNLFVLAGTISSYALHDGLPIINGTLEPAPLWLIQTRVLLTLSAVFSGKPSVVLRSVENLGLHAIDFRLRKTFLKRSNADELDWNAWIHRESSKRLLFGMYVVSNLISTTFGVMPAFSHTDDLDFEVLDEERFWNARTAQEWQHMRQMEICRERPSVRDILARMLLDKDYAATKPSYEVSVLTMLLITHALNIHTECMRQVIEKSPPRLHDTLLEPTISALSTCEDILAAARQRKDQSMPWTEAEGPLMFNCQGVVHMAHVRLFLDMSTFDRLMLINDNPDEIASAAFSFAEADLRRSPNLTNVIRKAFDRHHILVKLGHSLLRKTAALSWSLEHAVADWVGTLLITKWIHDIETNTLAEPPKSEEQEILQGFKHLLAETDCEYSGSSLASAVAHFRSTTLNDVWVWGVTPRMAHVLQHLAFVYEERHRSLQQPAYSSS
ncbi:hypothetical protein N0V90_010231 [Kalmusia sp. IMI 367209]|nr:hypothetical protein N0V90_010231 [Kalmusia sp. IMI 367209]